MTEQVAGHDYGADGLRGLASLNVVFSHYASLFVPILLAKNYVGIYPGDPDPSVIYDILRFPLLNIFYNGQFAVLVFFVLSGYVLTLPAHAGRRELMERRFWGRYIRLNIPVFVSVLIAWLLFVGGLFTTGGSSYLAERFAEVLAIAPTFWDMLAEGLFFAVFMGDPSLNTPLWSIGTEFIGSLLLLAFYMPQGRRKWVFVVAVFLLGVAVFTNSVIYLFAILLGARIVKLRPSRRMVMLYALIGIYLGGYQEGSIYYAFWGAENYIPSTKNMFNMFGALFLTTAIINGFASRITLSRSAQFLGRISFPLYVLHYLVVWTLGTYTFGVFPQFLILSGAHLLLFVGVSILVAMLFERFVDQPAIAQSRRFAQAVMRRLDGAAPAVTTAGRN